MGNEESYTEAKKTFDRNGNGEDGSITITKPFPTEEEQNKSRLKQILTRPDQRVHPAEYDESGNLPKPPNNFDETLKKAQEAIRQEKVKSAQSIFQQKEQKKQAVLEAKTLQKTAEIELPEAGFTDHSEESPEKEEAIFTAIDGAAEEFGLPKKLFRALIKQESASGKNLVSETGVVGIAQVTLPTMKEMMGEDEDGNPLGDRTNPAHSLYAGAKYLAKHIKDWKKEGFSERQSQQLATMSYNTGFARVKEAIKATGETHPGMQKIEDSGIELFKQRWDVKKVKGKRIASKKQTALNSFVQGSSHWKKIHYDGDTLIDYTAELAIDPFADKPPFTSGKELTKEPLPEKVPLIDSDEEPVSVPAKVQKPEKVILPTKVDPVTIIKKTDPRFPNAHIPHVPSPITNPDIQQPTELVDTKTETPSQSTASPRATTDLLTKETTKAPALEKSTSKVDLTVKQDEGWGDLDEFSQVNVYEAPPAEEDVSGGGFTSLESGTGPTEIPPKPGVIAQAVDAFKSGVGKAGESLSGIEVDEVWNQLLNTLAETPEIFQQGVKNSVDSLKGLAEGYMEYKGITGVSGNELVDYVAKNSAEFMDWVRQTKRLEQEEIERRTGKKYTQEYVGSKQERDKELKALHKKDDIAKVGGLGNWNAIQKDDQVGIQAGLDELVGKIEGANQTGNDALVKTLKEQYIKLYKFKKEKIVQKATETTYTPIKKPGILDKYPLHISVDMDVVVGKGLSSAWDMMPSAEIQAAGEGMLKMESLENKTPVVSTYGKNVFEHEDGRWSVQTHDGRVLNFHSEIEAKSYGDYNASNAKGMHEGAPIAGSPHEYFNRVMEGLAMPAELLGTAMTGVTTLIEKVEDWNHIEVKNGRTPITDEILEKYKNKELSVTDPFYETLSRLDKEAKKNMAQHNAIGRFAEGYRKYFPVNRKHMAGAATAFKLIHQSKKHGKLDSLLHVFNNIGTFMEQGFDSVGFTLALTLGNVPVQLGMLASLAKGQANKMIADYVKEHGKEPSLEIIERIKIAAAFSLAAEKISMGYMKGVVKGLPIVGDSAKWVGKVGAAINRSVDSNIATSLLKRVAVKPAISMFAEGVQERFSQEAEHYGMKGEWLPPEEGTLAIVSGMTAAPGVGGTLLTAQIGGKIVKTLLSPSKLKLQRERFQYELNRATIQAGQIDKHDRVSNLDEQIKNLEQEINPYAGPEGSGVETANERFLFHYDQARMNDIPHREAIADAQRRTESELKQLKQERAELIKDTPVIRMRDTHLADTIREQIKEIDRLISKGDNAQAIATLVNQKIDLEAILDSPINSEQLAAHKEHVLRNKKVAEKLLISTDPKASKEDKKEAEKDTL